MSYQTDLTAAPVSSVLAARDTLVALMDSAYPGKGWVAGGQLESLVIEPLAAGLGKIDADAEGVRAANSLADAATAGDTITVDRLLDNYGVKRSAAQAASGNVIVVTTTPSLVSIDVDVAFTTGGEVFYPIMAYRIYPTGVRAIDPLHGIDEYTKRADGNYEFTVAVRSVNTGSKTRVASNATFTISGVIPGLVTARSAADFVGGLDEQGVGDAVALARAGITPAVFTGEASIQKLLGEAFPGCTAGVVGAGHPCMVRDRDNLFGIGVGGKTDIYVRAAYASMVKTLRINAALFPVNRSSYTWAFQFEEPGAYKVVAIRPADTTALGGYAAATDVVTPKPPATGFVPKMAGDDALFTAHQLRDVTFVAADLNYGVILNGAAANAVLSKAFDVDVLYMPSIEAIDNYVRGSVHRDPGADFLVKAALPVIVDVNIAVRGTVDSTAAAAVSDAISALGQGINTIPASLIYDALRGHVKGNVGTVGFRAEVVGLDRKSRFVTSRAELVIPADAANGVSAESIAFLTSPGRIFIEVM